MTITSTARRAGPFAGNGVATTFPFSFKVFRNADIKLLRVDASGNSTTLTLDSDYSVTLNADQNSNPGGSIIYPRIGDPLPAGYQLVALGALADDQQTRLTNQGGFYPSTIEDMVDRSTIQIQQLAEITSRALVVTEAESTAPVLPPATARAGNILGFDPSGSVTMIPLPASVGAGDMRDEIGSDEKPGFVAGTDFIGGTTTQLVLSRAPGNKANVWVEFDAAYQGGDQIQSIVGNILTFTSAIPPGVQRVYVRTGTTLSLSTPAQQSVTDASLSPGSKVYNRTFNSVSVTDFPGCDPTGMTDSTAAFIAAKTAIEATGRAGRVDVPAGHYIVSGTISNDRSANSALPVVSWAGAGADATTITYTGNGTLFSIVGSTTLASLYGKISGMTLFGTGLANTFAFVPVLCSFFRFSDLHIEGFDYAYYCQDIDHTLYDNQVIRFNKKAFFAQQNPTPGPNSTCPNQLTFLQCAISSNSDYGVLIEQGAANTFVGCQFEVNGAGNAHGWGIKIDGASLQGGPAIIMEGGYFESNNGDADLILVSITPNLNPEISDATYVLNGVSFNRASATYKANSILTNFGPQATVGQQILVLNGCTFKGYNSYVPNVATPYINFSGSQTRNKNNFVSTGCVYQSPLEAPTAVQNPAMCYVEIGKTANQSLPSATLTTWAIDHVYTGFSWSTVPAADAITIPEAGCYNIDVCLTFAGPVTGLSIVMIMKNGVAIGYGEATNSLLVSASCTKTFLPGDAISVLVSQSSGSAATIANTGSANSYLALTKLIDG
jgi:hypothetical protein